MATLNRQPRLPKTKACIHPLKPFIPNCFRKVLKRVDRAYENFFRRLKRLKAAKEKNGNGKAKAGYPRLKGENRYDSLTYPQQPGFQLTQNGLKLSKIGTIKIKQHRLIKGIIKTCTIKRDLDRWYACFSVEIPEKTELQQPKTAPSHIGIDVGLNSFAVFSDGTTCEYIDNPKYLKQSEQRLSFVCRKHSKKAKSSKNRKKSRLKVAKVHRKIREQRQDFQHKLSRRLVDNYDLIAIEKLNIKGMVCNHHLSKSISDAAWGQFLNFINYKAAEAGKWCIEVSPNGTTQICSGCGTIVPKDLSIRIHNCFVCGLKLNRDHNAALNILSKALATVGTTESYAWGGIGVALS